MSQVIRHIKEERTETPKGQLIFGIVFLCAVILTDFLFARYLYHSMTEVDAIPVRQLQVDGELNYLTQKDVADYFLNNYDNLNLLTMDLGRVRKYLLEMPWVRSVSVRKRLPNILYVYLTEYKPAAFFNDGILTKDWKVIKPNLTNFKEPLVHLAGPENSARSIYDRYVKFSTFLNVKNYIISSLTLTDSYMWEVRLTTGLTLYLGRDAETIGHDVEDSDQASEQQDILLKRLDMFVELYPRLERRQDLEYIDLRYDTGAAVRWRDGEQNQLSQEKK